MVKFCTECGTKLNDDDLFCGECGTKQEVIESNPDGVSVVSINKTPADKNALKAKVKEVCGGISRSDIFKNKLVENGHEKSESNSDYLFILFKEIDTKKLIYVEDVEPRLDELLKLDIKALRKQIVGKKNMDSSQFKTQEDIDRVVHPRHSKKWHDKQNAPIKDKITALTGKNLSDSPYFKARKEIFNVNDVHTYYKKILNFEVDHNALEYDDVEARLDELLQMNNARVLYELRLKKPTHLFKTQQDIEQYIGYGTVKNPIPISDEEMKKINEKIEDSDLNRSVALKNIISEESHKKDIEKIRETKQVDISIPNGRKLLNSPLTGALTGDIIAGGAGRMIGGLAGAGDVLGGAMGALNGGLILGGAGALIGGLLAAKDDGIEWFDTVLVLNETEAIIAGKIVLPYKDIKLVNAEKGSKFDVVTLTMEKQGLQFKTSNGMALKEVMDEMMENCELNNVEPEQITTSDNTASATNNVEALMKYAELYEKGLLTEEEFAAKKKELL